MHRHVKSLTECCSHQYTKQSADMNGNATIKGEIVKSVTLNLSPLHTPEIQLYLAIHTNGKAMFVRGCWKQSPQHPSPKAVGDLVSVL